jgi:hypothetical protein
VFTSTSYENVAALFAAATGWLERLGISHRVTRLGEYQTALRDLTDANSRGSTLRNELPALNTAVYEAHELVEVYEALAGRHDDTLRKHLKTLAAGPAVYSEENPDSSSNRSRNVAFELAVMGYLAQAGLTLAFDSLADASATFKNRTLLFECKRPQSLAAVERNVKDALKQLSQRINGIQRVRHRGIVALDITKAMNPSFEVFTTEREQDIDFSMSQQVDRFIERYMNTWTKPRCNQNIGVLIRLRQMNIVEYEGYSKLFHGQQVAILPFKTCGGLNHELLASFTQHLSTSRSAV